ncbi:uncharacterized protein LOC8069163 isoform X1 [Sorghum bicolor]|uniref:uncharacterized protein LOC8069163 isoform X1 n=1 Tax=Sorghum bicolor TaxID=4558 RepID=UPI000B42371C|nr:uncharacterized protein LOC8069163 isoform X1 [Sorghum bicolor]|eukprot:XP_021304557.1 uncharacterized protein LOC8069163 isoform X1 [Sorghum bicolor]
MSAAADDLARRVAAFLPVPPPPPPQKQQLSGVAAAVLDAGGRLGRAVGDVFRRLRIDDTFYSGGGGGGGVPKQRRRSAGKKKNGGRRSAAGASAAVSKEGDTGGGDDPLGSSGRFARAQGSMNLSATYDSRTNDVESSVVARGDLWRAEASHSSSSSSAAASASAPTGAGAGYGANLFLVQLGPVLFVRDTTLLFPVHLSKRHLIWYGFERKNGVHSVCPAYWSAHKRWFFMSMLCLNPFACSFMDMQFPNGQLRYVAGDGFTARAFLPVRGGILQAHGKFPGEKRLSFSFKNRSGGSVVPMVQWPDKSLSLGIVQALSWRTSGLMLQPATQISICPTIGGRHPGVCMELIHSANDNVGVVCGYSHTASPSAYASISVCPIGRSKLNGGAARSGLVFRVDAPLHGFGRPWFSVQMNSGIEF